MILEKIIIYYKSIKMKFRINESFTKMHLIEKKSLINTKNIVKSIINQKNCAFI